MAERSVLHVLPHPGGGGETYVELLSEMPGYRFERTYLAPSPRPSALDLARGVGTAFRKGRRHDLLHLHGEAAAGLCLPLLGSRPSVVTLNGLHLVRRLGGVARRAAVLNLRLILRATDRMICVARTEHELLEAFVGREPSRRAVVIHNGVPLLSPAGELARAELRAELAVPEAECVAIWVGSLDERKDPLTAIRAAERAGITLLVAGDGPLRSQVEHAAGNATRVLGQRDDVPRLLAAADLFVLTSRREGLALSLLEAMASGLPAVVTEIAENKEAIAETGIAVSSGDELITALRRLAGDAELRAALGAEARRRAARLFAAETMVSRTRAIYEDVLRARRARP